MDCVLCYNKQKSFQEGDPFVIMDDGDSYPANPPLFYEIVQAKRSPYLLM